MAIMPYNSLFLLFGINASRAKQIITELALQIIHRESISVGPGHTYQLVVDDWFNGAAGPLVVSST